MENNMVAKKVVRVNRTGKQTERTFDDGSTETEGTQSGQPEEEKIKLQPGMSAGGILVSTSEPTEAPFEETAKAQRQKGTAPVSEGRTAAQFQAQQQIAQQPVETARTPATQAFKEGEVPGAIGEPTALQQAAASTGTLRAIEKRGFATEQEVARFGLTELDIETIKSGEAFVNELAAATEGLPILGKRIPFLGVSIASLVGTTPSEKVEEQVKLISATNANINQWSELAKTNPMQASQYINLIKKAEQEVLRYESKIQILTLQSPELQANPEQINLMKTEINLAKGNIQDKRNELLLLGLR